MDKIEFILTVTEIKGIGKKIARELCEIFYTSKISLDELYESVQLRYPRIIFTLDEFYEANLRAKNILLKCDNLGIGIMDYTNNLFPRKLNALKNPPVLLYYKGEIERLNEKPSIAIIGTREPSHYGKLIAEKYADYFVKKDFNIISGLAKGIDGIGQKSAVDSNGYTVAFLAQGLNTEIYPKENRSLAASIIEKGGALISEYAPDVKPNKNYFVERDRLQSGASDAVLVIETDIIGGTMHAVNSILELNRKLGVLDHPEKFRSNNQKSYGNQKLIADGSAVPLFSLKSLDSFSNELIHLSSENDKELLEKQIHLATPSINADKKTNGLKKAIKKNSKNSRKIVAENQIGFEDDLFNKGKT